MLINRNGLEFVDNKTTRTYKGSGLRFSSYYKRVCTRCGWSFAGPRWEKHNHTECDKILLERSNNTCVDSFVKRNLGI